MRRELSALCAGILVLFTVISAQSRFRTVFVRIAGPDGKPPSMVTITLRENDEIVRPDSVRPSESVFSLDISTEARYDLSVEVSGFDRWVIPLNLVPPKSQRMELVSSTGLKAFIVIGLGATAAPRPSPPPPPPPSLPTSGDGQTHAIVSVFYATDRNRLSSQPVSYGTQREPTERLHFGRFDVSIPKAAHDKGQIERPTIWSWYREDPNKHIYIMRRFEQTHDTFYRELSGLVSDSTRKHIFVFVHGYNVPFEDAIFRTAQVAYDLRFDGAPILYSWPSESALFNYFVDANNAEWTAPHLQWFLQDVASKTGAQAIHVVAHSMGNRPVVNALSRIALESPTLVSRFSQVVLTAPDIDAAVFRQLATTLRRAAQRVTLYASSSDLALRTSAKFQGYQRAGDTEPNVVIVDGVETIDVSATDTDLIGIGHSYYADRGSVLADLYYLIREGFGADRRAGLEPRGQTPNRYWVFQR